VPQSQSLATELPDKPSILVVDDELGYREAVTRILRSRGFQADCAEDGRKALAKIEQHDYPIMLVDLKMPEMDGFELIQRLSETRPDTLCIVVSAFATIESAVETTKMGAFDFVVKPFFPDDLMVVVNRACDKWRLAQEALRLRNEREAHLLELAAEKSRIRTIIQSMGDGLLVVNVDGDVVLDNRAARRLLGRVQDPVHEPLKNVIHDEKLLDEVAKVFLQKSQGEVVLELHIPSPSQAHQDRYLRASINPVEGHDGPPIGAVVLLSDITDAKAFDRMKTLFISMVAHELKAPIGAVEGYTTRGITLRFSWPMIPRCDVAGAC
jgi:PAS domain S-box-containing protein